MKGFKKAMIICLLIIITLSANIIRITATFNFLTSESFYSLLPYETVCHWLLYDHIEYNGVDYYYADSDKQPDGVIPDFRSEIGVLIVDSDSKPYDENQPELAYLCQNDPEGKYIYYVSAYFVNDISLVDDFNFDDE